MGKRSVEMNENTDFVPEEQENIDTGSEVKGGLFASLVDIFVDPAKVFRRIDAGLQWWKAFIVVAIVIVAMSWINLPVQKHVLLLNERGMSEEQLEMAVQNTERFGFVGLIIAPIAVLVIWLIIGALVNVSVNLVSGRSGYKKCLSIIGFTAMIGLLEQIIQTVIIHARGISSIESSADVKAPLGLAALFPESGGFARALMDSLSIFQIWYLIVFTVGISLVFNVDKKKAVIPTIVVWLISLIFLWIGSLFGGG
jgi:hypothetical protein